MQKLGEAFHKTKYCSLLLDFSPLEEISCRKAKCEPGLDMEYFVHRHGIYCKISVQIAGMRHTLKRSNSPDLHIGQLGCCSNRLSVLSLFKPNLLCFSFVFLHRFPSHKVHRAFYVHLFQLFACCHSKKAA